MKTNTGLVEYVKKAERENWGYVLGTFGQTLTPALLRAKMAQGYGVGAYNTRHQARIRAFMGKKVSDCYGLVKGYLWTNGGEPKYTPGQDRNQEGAYLAAKEKGPLSTLPEIPGVILWMKGHAGVYIGNGEFIEIAGQPKNVVRGKIINGRVTKGSPFTHWFKDTYINYVGPIKPTQPVGPVIHDININFLGQQLKVKGTLINGTNYMQVGAQSVPLRDIFEAMGYNVGWNQATSTILVNK